MELANRHPVHDTRSDRFPTEWAFGYSDEEDRASQSSQPEGARLEGQIPGQFPVSKEDRLPDPPLGGFFG